MKVPPALPQTACGMPHFVECGSDRNGAAPRRERPPRSSRTESADQGTQARREGRQRIGVVDRQRTLVLAELATLAIEREGKVRVTNARQAEQFLQQDLTRRRIDEIGAAHDVRDSLRRIVTMTASW
jgi:hypothetical protein